MAAQNNAFYILYTMTSLFALYLSFKRNNGVDVGSFLVALFFPWLYIAYYLGTNHGRF